MIVKKRNISTDNIQNMAITYFARRGFRAISNAALDPKLCRLLHQQGLASILGKELTYRVKRVDIVSNKNCLHCVERILLSKVKFCSATLVYLLRWSHGKQQQHKLIKFLFQASLRSCYRRPSPTSARSRRSGSSRTRATLSSGKIKNNMSQQ